MGSLILQIIEQYKNGLLFWLDKLLWSEVPEFEKNVSAK